MARVYSREQASAILDLYGPDPDEDLRATVAEILRELPPAEEKAVRLAFGMDVDARLAEVEPVSDWRKPLGKIRGRAETLLRHFMG